VKKNWGGKEGKAAIRNTGRIALSKRIKKIPKQNARKEEVKDSDVDLKGRKRGESRSRTKLSKDEEPD